MQVIRIEEPSDPRLAPYFNLRSGQNTPDSFIVESARLVQRLAASPFVTHSILVTENRLASLDFLAASSLPIFVVSKKHLQETVGFDLHRGCLAHATAPDISLPEHLENNRSRLVVILEGLADPSNVGAIIRNAAAFGADLVVVDPKGASPFTRKATRASAGQIFQVPVALCAPEQAISSLRNVLKNVQIIATTGRPGAAALQDIGLCDHNVLIFGNEGTGITPSLREIADITGRIPIAEHVDSLNVAAASAVALHIVGNLASQ